MFLSMYLTDSVYTNPISSGNCQFPEVKKYHKLEITLVLFQILKEILNISTKNLSSTPGDIKLKN